MEECLISLNKGGVYNSAIFLNGVQLCKDNFTEGLLREYSVL